MKTRCWACGVLGLVLFYAYAHAADENKPELPLVKKGSVVSVSDKEIVIKAKDDKVGEVKYPLEKVSQHVQLDEDVIKSMAAEMKTRGKYFAAPALKPSELQAGTEVSISYGASFVSDGGKQVEAGNRYQIKVLKLPQNDKK